MHSAIVVFAKVPGRRRAKTRIAAQSGWPTAERIYAELLAATARTVAALPYHVAYTAGPPEPLAQHFTHARSLFQQSGETLGDRLHAAAGRMWSQGYRSVCFVGSDCPWMARSTLEQACGALAGGIDVVLGPAHDGGYYLAGCGRRGEVIFDARDWSLPTLFEETMRIIHDTQLDYRILPPLGDVDSLDDYLIWKGESQR